MIVLIGGVPCSGKSTLVREIFGELGTPEYVEPMKGFPCENGLGANGKDGVTQTLEILQKELDLTMGLCGKRNLADVDKSILYQYK